MIKLNIQLDNLINIIKSKETTDWDDKLFKCLTYIAENNSTHHELLKATKNDCYEWPTNIDEKLREAVESVILLSFLRKKFISYIDDLNNS